MTIPCSGECSFILSRAPRSRTPVETMALIWSRVLTLAKIGSSRISLQLHEARYRFSSRGFASTDHSNSNPLLLRLLQEPSSSVKSVLDSPESAFLCSSEVSCKSLVRSLVSSSSPKKAQLVTSPPLFPPFLFLYGCRMNLGNDLA